MLVVVWVVVLDSQSVLMVTNVLVPEESSLAWHDSLDLESNTVSKWVSWVVNSSSVNGPSLVLTVMAFEPDGVSVVRVVCSVDIKAETGSVSDVSVMSWEV